MKRFAFFKTGLTALAAVFLLSTGMPQTVHAQDSFDGIFGGLFRGQMGGGQSGRYEIRFSKKYRPGTIIVSFGDRRLYYINRPGSAISYPIGVPSGDARWSGTLRVSQKRVNPGWTPTASMRRENPELPAHVPGGHPRNPLGVRALYLGSTLYRIHGTDAPWTVGQNVTHGCIRLYNKDIVDLYNRARVGTLVIVTGRSFRG